MTTRGILPSEVQGSTAGLASNAPVETGVVVWRLPCAFLHKAMVVLLNKNTAGQRAWSLQTQLRRLMPKTVRGTLVCLLAGIVASLALATAGIVIQQVRANQREQSERLGAIAAALLGAIDAELARGQALLETLAVSPQLKTGNFRAVYEYARVAADLETDRVVVLVAADGQPVFSTGAEWGKVLPNVLQVADEDRQVEWNGHQLPLGSGDLISRALRTNSVAYSNLYYAANVGRPAVALAIPVMVPGHARHALLLSLSPALLQQIVRKSVTAPDVLVAVADRDGLVVANNSASMAQIGQRVLLTTAMLHQQSGVFSATTREGSEVNGAFAVSDRNGLTVGAYEPASSLLADASGLAWIGLYLAVFGAGVALVHFHSRQLVVPVTQLAAAVSSGGAPPAYRGHLAELALLYRTVLAAAEATRLRQESDERKMSELQYRALFSEQMIGIVGHDLRNPILSAQFSLRAMQAQDAPGAENLRHLGSALDQAQCLVHDLLDFTRARIGSGIAVDLAPLNLHELVRQQVNLLRYAYNHRPVLHEEVGEGPCEADGNRLRQVVDNLVSNAVAYGAPHTPVTIRSIVADGFFTIEVHNEGDPIPADVLPHVFEPMVRSSASHRERPGGVGLGLYIVRKIAEAHAGEVKVTSSGHSGTTFTVTFPR